MSFICESMTMGGSTFSSLGQIVSQGGDAWDKIRLSFAGIGAWKWLLMPPLPRGWLSLVGGCQWARFMSFICGPMANRVCNVDQIPMSAANLRTGKFHPSFLRIGAWEGLTRPPQPWGWLLHVGGCPGARFMSFICESMTMGGSTSSNSGQIVGKGGAKFAYRLLELGRGSGS